MENKLAEFYFSDENELPTGEPYTESHLFTFDEQGNAICASEIALHEEYVYNSKNKIEPPPFPTKENALNFLDKEIYNLQEKINKIQHCRNLLSQATSYKQEIEE